MTGIYKFTNKITGESYIGQSVDIQKRYNQHKNRYDTFGTKKVAKENTYFHEMLRWYGFHNFDFEILEECKKEQLNEREIYYINKFSSQFPNGYNKTSGGNTPHTNALQKVDCVYEIRELLKTSELSNIEIGKLFGISDQMVSDINSGRCWFDSSIHYPIRNGYRKCCNNQKSFCTQCGVEISERTKTSLCKKCVKIMQRKCKNIPNKDELYKLLTKNSFLSVGKLFGVSDNAVRKWCDKYELPRNSKYYRSVIC